MSVIYSKFLLAKYTSGALLPNFINIISSSPFICATAEVVEDAMFTTNEAAEGDANTDVVVYKSMRLLPHLLMLNRRC